MKKSTKGCLVVLAVVLGIVATLSTAIVISAGHSLQKFDNANHRAILAACRDMLSQRESYRKSSNYRPPKSWEGSSITLVRDPAGFGPDIPEAIRELNPMWVVINEDSVLIKDVVGFFPMRLCMIAFPESADVQYGTKQYLDGLWYWGSTHLHQSVRGQSDRRTVERNDRIKANQTSDGIRQPADGSPKPSM